MSVRKRAVERTYAGLVQLYTQQGFQRLVKMVR